MLKTVIGNSGVEQSALAALPAFLREEILHGDALYAILPGFCDVHVHFREPGFSYKETIASGTLAAARGGYTTVCTMPNLNPVPDSLTHLQEQLRRIESDAVIGVYPYGAITVGQQGTELADLEGMSGSTAAFSDDGRGVQSVAMMREAMLTAKRLGKLIAAHCEVNELLRGGYIHDGDYARAHGHKGISAESEWRMVQRDLALAEETGCSYHVCHISCRESVELLRSAKRRGVPVSCETAPHYLLMDDSDLEEDGRFKMNPPLRGAEDRLALLAGLRDGTIDMIATDHAPHSEEEKSKGLQGSAFGIVGLETAFPVLYSGLVRSGVISLEKLTELLCTSPRRRFGLPADDGWSLWELSTEYEINPEDFASKGRATPFAGRRVYGRCLRTVYQGKTVYQI